MKQRTIVLLGVVAVVGALGVATVGNAFAQGQPQPGFGPDGMMGGWGNGSGMMGQPGPGGMMGGAGDGPGMMGSGSGGTSGQAQPLNSLEDASQAFQRYLDATGNPDLALDEVMEFQWNYYASVNDTSTGQGAFELLANPQSGAVVPEMGPNMMWNTRYGPMAGLGMMGGLGQQPSSQPTVSSDGAQQLAQDWLDQNQPGSAADAPDTFPGYYTVNITMDGQLSGMLSVNAYTGQVWYHSWHGTFVASIQA